MSEKRVAEEVYQYTELVYYDEGGREVHRERQYDDFWYDTASTREPTEVELLDFYEEEN